MEKIEKRKERKLSRRKTVTGVPAVDDTKNVSRNSNSATPIEIQDELKKVNW